MYSAQKYGPIPKFTNDCLKKIITNQMKALPYFILFVLATSCNSIYLPNAQNVPTFTKAKEFEGNGQLQVYVLPYAYSAVLQGAYSITNHLGAIGNYSYSRNSSGQGGAQLGELGIGYYNANQNRNFSVFGGYALSSSSGNVDNFSRFGFAHNDSISSNNANWVESSYRSVFLQPSYTWIVSDGWSLAMSMKVSRINFENTYYGSYYSYNNNSYVDFTLPEKLSASYHFDTAATLKVKLGEGPMNFVFQGGLHVTNDNYTVSPSNFGWVSMGLQLKLPIPKK